MRVDLHCHLLPAVDDGAKHLDQALAMAKIAIEDGITDIICTPHHLNGVYQNNASSILSACHQLQGALDDQQLPLTVHPGAENHLVPELLDGLRAGSVMTMAHRGRYLLVELPVMSIPMGTEQVLKSLLKQGLTPIIAHPERNDALRLDPTRLGEWVDWGVLGQVTAQSLTGQFGPLVQQAAWHMTEQGWIHCVASDAHRDKRRIPIISPAHQAISERLGLEFANWLVDAVPRAVLLGQAVDRVDHDDQITKAQSHYTRRPWWRRWF